MADALISRADARTSGLNHYFTGCPCKHGHLSPRYVYNTKCVSCIAGYHEQNKEHRNKRARERPSRRDKQRFAEWLVRTKKSRSLRMKAYNADPKNKERKGIVTRAWVLANKEHISARYLQKIEQIRRRQKDYRDRNKEKIYKKIKEWRSQNRDLLKVYHHKRRALKRGASGSHTAQDLQEIIRLQKNKCAYCRSRFGKTLIPTLDHIVALVNGGTNDRKNLQYLCGPCNSSKKERDPIVFSRSQGMLL